MSGVGTAVLAASWTDGASLGYPVLVGGVLLGSMVPVVPTGPLLSVAAAVAVTTDRMDIVLVVLLATVAAYVGDVVTFTVARFGGPSVVRWMTRGQHAARLEQVRGQFRRHGWQLVVVGRLLPAGRIPVLVAAGALAYPWRRLLPTSAAAALLWALAYSAIGVVSGGVSDSPLVAVGIALVLVLLVAVVGRLATARRGERAGTTQVGGPVDGGADSQVGGPVDSDR